jgi:hypothetical protein
MMQPKSIKLALLPKRLLARPGREYFPLFISWTMEEARLSRCSLE